MSANSINRSVARHALGALLKTGLVGAGKPTQVVYDYKAGDFKGMSPAVVIASDGISRKQFQMATSTRRVNIYLAIWIFVLYADPATGYTESDAEDAIDLVEKSVADILIDNMQNANWTLLTIEDRSQIDTVIIGGAEYQREVIVVKLDIPMG